MKFSACPGFSLWRSALIIVAAYILKLATLVWLGMWLIVAVADSCCGRLKMQAVALGEQELTLFVFPGLWQ
jgi:hypothetical protein